ncbi:S-adenosyl-L-methionine-dependent methyltransferase [Thozetella sp. PMI_491]|nr:S-adenosyl-L-methionine-dependent methyltransferase [Thozetella sp. PMI_491]
MAEGSSSKPTHLDPSELGTRQYWDNLYTAELTNHASNPADEGTVWFDDSDAEAKVVEFLASHAVNADEPAEESLGLDPASATALDLGCGNGSLLFALRDAGWAGRLLGVDYSERSVALAQQIQEARAVATTEEQEEDAEGRSAGGSRPVELRAWDVLRGPLEDVRADEGAKGTGGRPGWDIVLDKGTFDAVSLSGERDDAGRRVSEGYRTRVLQLLREGGIFLVTSCNWTEPELEEWFAPSSSPPEEEVDGRLAKVGRVQYRTFSFGGVKGQTISTLCFQKKT